MEYITRKVPSDFKLIDASDLHYDAFNCHRTGLKKMINKCLDYNQSGVPCYVNLKGDLIEGIIPGDKRFNSAIHDAKFPTPQDACDALVEELWSIRKYILCIGMGNHEYSLINITNFSKYLADKLEVPYGAYCYITEFIDEDTGDTLFKTYSNHGSGKLPSGAKDHLQRDANRKAHIKRRLISTRIADCVYMSYGHTHQLYVIPPTFDMEKNISTSSDELHQHAISPVKQNSSMIPPDQRWYANTGGFLKLYTPSGLGLVSYAEKGMLEPTDLGWVEIDVMAGEIVNVEAIKL